VPSAKYGNPGDVKHVLYAANYLISLIDAYIVKGDPYLLSDPDLRARAAYNAAVIGMGMRLFPICHELAHLVYRHLGRKARLSKDEAWSHEFLADEVGSSFVGGFSRDYDPESMITSIWACNVVLYGFQILEECVAYLNTGSWTVPERDTHPSHEERRRNIFKFQAGVMIDAGRDEDVSTFQDLCNEGEVLIRDLYSRVAPHVKELRRSGVKPSPIWHVREVSES
jgi:hypothetical protein